MNDVVESTDSNESELDDGPIQTDEMTWGDRMLVDRGTLSPRHRKLVELAAAGMRNQEIARTLGYTDSRISILLTNSRIRSEVERFREKIFEETVGRRLKDMARPALDELDRCLGDTSNRYKENLKVETAKWIIEKLDGKAIQKYDVGENLLSLMMDRLDAMKSTGRTQVEAIEVTPNEEQTHPTPQIPERTEEDFLRDWCLDFKTKRNS